MRALWGRILDFLFPARVVSRKIQQITQMMEQNNQALHEQQLIQNRRLP